MLKVTIRKIYGREDVLIFHNYEDGKAEGSMELSVNEAEDLQIKLQEILMDKTEAETKKTLLVAFRTILDILQEHDCHASPDDGCATCADLQDFKNIFSRLI